MKLPEETAKKIMARGGQDVLIIYSLKNMTYFKTLKFLLDKTIHKHGNL